MSRRSLQFILCVRQCALAAIVICFLSSTNWFACTWLYQWPLQHQKEHFRLWSVYLHVCTPPWLSKGSITVHCWTCTRISWIKCSCVLLLLPLPLQMKNVCGTLDHSSDSLTNNYIIWNYCSKDIPKIYMGGAAPPKIEQWCTCNVCSELK